jgi:hypothetical protein
VQTGLHLLDQGQFVRDLGQGGLVGADVDDKADVVDDKADVVDVDVVVGESVVLELALEVRNSFLRKADALLQSGNFISLH